MAGSMTQKIYDSLKNEYSRAENELKSVDKNLKTLTGGSDVFEKSSSTRKHEFDARKSNRYYFDDKRYLANSRSNDMNRKRRLSDTGSARIFSRLDKRLDDSDRKRPSLQSTIVTTALSGSAIKVKEENVIKDDKEPDQKSAARNRRMFGVMLGTLQKFQSEESRRKVVTIKREEIEKKLDQEAEEEKEAVKKEKLSLIKSKRDKQSQLRDIETKMDRVEIHQHWEKSNQHLTNFIQTKTKPQIFYMPNKHTPETEKRLKETKDKYLIILAEKRAKIQKQIEDLNKKNEDESARDSHTPVKEEKLKNGDHLKAHSKEEVKSDEKKENKHSKENSEQSKSKKLKMDTNDVEDGECDSNGETTTARNRDEDNSTNDDGKSSQSIEEDSSKPATECTDTTDQLNDENQSNSNLNEGDQSHKQPDHHQTDQIQDENSQPPLLKASGEDKDDKEFEPIYDE